MASSAIYPPSTTLPSWEYGGYDDHHPEYTPYTSSRPLRRHSQHQQVYQVWMPPRYSTGSYPDSPGHASPPPLRHFLANDPAFAVDPGINPDYLYHQMDAQLTIPFPARSYSGSDLPPGFVPQPGPVPNTSYRAHSYHEDLARQSSVPQSFYSHPSLSSSSSGSDSSTSSIARPPLSLVRSSSNTHEHSDSHLRFIPPMEAPYAPPDEVKSHPRKLKHRPKRPSPRAAQPANDQAKAMVPFPADRNSHSVMSSTTGSGSGSGSLPASLSEQSNDSRGRTSSTSRPTLDLDSIDELDETNPHGFNVHHRGPYEAVAAILNDTAPVDSPLLRAQGVQQQLSTSGRLRPSMRVNSEPNANPMSLNLQPGQILQGSIYLPTQPSHFPPEFSVGARPPNRDARPPPGPVEFTIAGNDAARSPLRRNQTLPAASLARGPSEQGYRIPPPVTSEVQAYQHAYLATSNSNVHQSSRPQPYPVDSQNNVPPRSSGQRQMSQMSRYPPDPSYAPQSTGVDHGTTRRPPYADTSLNIRQLSQLAPVAPVVPPEAPPTPDIDLRLSRTLYLTNPDENLGTPDHRLRTSSLSPAAETAYGSGDRRMGKPSRSHRHNFDSVQPLSAATHALADSGARRKGPMRTTTVTASEQDSPRRFEPPSQALAAMKAQFVGQAASATSSSSHTSSSLAPRHIPKHLVMPTPLADASQGTFPTAPSVAASSRTNRSRSGQSVHKGGDRPGDGPRPQRSQTFPSRVVSRGVFSFFRFGKSSKPVREVRLSVTEPPMVGMSEKGQRRVRTQSESRKLRKRR